MAITDQFCKSNNALLCTDKNVGNAKICLSVGMRSKPITTLCTHVFSWNEQWKSPAAKQHSSLMAAYATSQNHQIIVATPS